MYLCIIKRVAFYSRNPHGLLPLESVQVTPTNLRSVYTHCTPHEKMMGQGGKIRALAKYIDFNSVIFRLKREALWFPNLVSLLPKSKIKRANLLAVCQYINCIHRRLRLTERGRIYFKTNVFGKDRVQQI